MALRLADAGCETRVRDGSLLQIAFVNGDGTGFVGELTDPVPFDEL